MNDYFTEQEIRNKLTGMADAKKYQGGMSAVARDLGRSQSYLSQVVSGERGVSKKLAADLGYRVERVFFAREPIRDASASAEAE